MSDAISVTETAKLSTQSTINRMSGAAATVATIRDRWDRQVAHFAARPVGRKLAVSLHFDQGACNLPCKTDLASLANENISMLLSGVLRYEANRNGSNEVVYVDEFIARASNCQLRLVYDREGIDQSLSILEDIWN